MWKHSCKNAWFGYNQLAVTKFVVLYDQKSMLKSSTSFWISVVSTFENHKMRRSILILKVNFLCYAFLRTCCSADAETTAEVPIEYLATFVPILFWFFINGELWAHQASMTSLHPITKRGSRSLGHNRLHLANNRKIFKQCLLGIQGK